MAQTCELNRVLRQITITKVTHGVKAADGSVKTVEHLSVCGLERFALREIDEILTALQLTREDIYDHLYGAT